MNKKNNKNITLYPCTNRRGQANKPAGFDTPCHISEGDTEQLAKAVAWDNCIAMYKDGRRKTENYQKADCILADIDNTHSDKESDWITHENVKKTLPDVAFYYYPSRNHMKQKDGKCARPKEHFIFPTHILESAVEYSNTAKTLVNTFPQLHFDTAVTGAAQLNFGVEDPVVSYVDGSITITDYILSIKQKTPEQTPDTKSENNAIIPQGERNIALHNFALRVLTRYGATEQAYTSYQKEAQKCSPLLEQTEVQNIWNGAVDYYSGTIKTQGDYVAPFIYNGIPSTARWALPPVDPTAVQQLYSIDKKYRKFNIATAKLILKAVGVTIRYNDMDYKTEVSGIPEKYGDNDLYHLLVTFVSDIASVMSYSRTAYKTVRETLFAIAHENHYHPVLSLLHEQSWDRIDRLPDIYAILNLTDHNYQTLFKKWAIQTIAILFNSKQTPVTAEGVLVLQGKQGIGKTQFFRHLAIQDSFFKGGATLDMNNKDSLMSATKVWICELGEIDSTTKKEQSALKAFLTEQTDNYRELYDRDHVLRPRKTSFCGTVNPQYYLQDETGNRRYWTIPVKNIDLKQIFALSPEWYTQFWRQILVLYRDNPNGYLLNTEEKTFVNQNNQVYEQLIFGEDEFLAYFNIQADRQSWQWLSAAEIADLLNKKFKSLHITSTKVGKLITRIESRDIATFRRKTIRGRRLILCPPSMEGNDFISPIPPQDVTPQTPQTIPDIESVNF